MTSIIDSCNAGSDLKYTLSSATAKSDRKTEYGLAKDSNYFYTSSWYSTAPIYWQISFSKQVSIISYSICTKLSNGQYAPSWEVSYSNDGTTFIPLQTDEMKSANTNAVNYPLSKAIACKHFRIKVADDTWLAVSKFDLFGSIQVLPQKKNVNICTINIGRIRHQIIGNILIAMMPSLTT